MLRGQGNRADAVMYDLGMYNVHDEQTAFVVQAEHNGPRTVRVRGRKVRVRVQTSPLYSVRDYVTARKLKIKLLSLQSTLLQ